LILGEKIMGNTPNPVSVYPDPDGKSNANTAPSDTRLTGGAMAMAGGSAVTLAIGSGTVPDPVFLFFQQTGGHGGGFLGFHAANGTYVAIGLVLASLSTVLSAINLVYGLRMRDRLRELSIRVCEICKANGVFDSYAKTKKSEAAA
jgi:hypothetical protein